MGLTHAKIFLVDLIKCTKANLKWQWTHKSDKFAPKNNNFPEKGDHSPPISVHFPRNYFDPPKYVCLRAFCQLSRVAFTHILSPNPLERQDWGVGRGVKPTLAMPGFWKRLLLKPLPPKLREPLIVKVEMRTICVLQKIWSNWHSNLKTDLNVFSPEDLIEFAALTTVLEHLGYVLALCWLADSIEFCNEFRRFHTIYSPHEFEILQFCGWINLTKSTPILNIVSIDGCLCELCYTWHPMMLAIWRQLLPKETENGQFCAAFDWWGEDNRLAESVLELQSIAFISTTELLLVAQCSY